ncbi:MAG: tetratricopeptide repeat protein, partial [Streptosporangiaceae bacterium]
DREGGPVKAISADRQAGPTGLLQVLEATGALLWAMVRSTEPTVLAHHAWGRSDPEGFAAMGVVETLLHTHDAAQGLGLAWEPPADLCRRSLARLFPDAPLDTDPWATLLWSTGRGELPGRAPLESWRWFSAPRSPKPAPIEILPPADDLLSRTAQARDRHDFLQLGALAEELLRSALTLNDAGRLALALQCVQETATGLGDYPRALAVTSAWLRDVAAQRRRDFEAACLHSWGVFAGRAGDVAGSRRALEQAAAIAVQLGDLVQESASGYELAFAAEQHGDVPGAEILYTRVHQIALQLGDRADEAYALYGLGRCALERHDKARAEYLLELAIDIAEQLGNEELQQLIADDLIAMIGRSRR